MASKHKEKTCVVQRRLAWPVSTSEAYNEKVFRVAEEMFRKTWRHRYR